MLDLDWSSIPPALPLLWRGARVTLEITAAALAGGLLLGTLLAVARVSPLRPLAWLSAAYVDTFRTIPLVMVLLWFFLVVPAVTAFLFTRQPKVLTAIAFTTGALASALGLWVSYNSDLPTGPTIVCSYGVVLLLAAALYRIRRPKAALTA